MSANYLIWGVEVGGGEIHLRSRNRVEESECVYYAGITAGLGARSGEQGGGTCLYFIFIHAGSPVT